MCLHFFTLFLQVILIRGTLIGYVFSIDGSTMSLKAMLQPSISLSTTGVEHMALAKAIKEAIWLMEQHSPHLFCDS